MRVVAMSLMRSRRLLAVATALAAAAINCARVTPAAEDAPSWRVLGALAALEDSNPSIRAKGLLRLRALHAISLAKRADLEPLLDSKNESLVDAAIVALGSLGATDLTDRFRAMLPENAEDARRCAVAAA